MIGRNLVYGTMLMFVSPFFSLFYGLRSHSRKLKQWLLILFITVYGSIIIIPEGADGTRHLENVYVHYVSLSFEQFSYELYRILTFQLNYVTQEDAYIHILSYFTGAILGLPELFFVFVAFIYAYFFSKSMLGLFKYVPRRQLSWLFYGFALVFILLKNIEGVNTVRTWTGLWVLFYGALRYFETKEKKYLLLLLLPPMIHHGFYAMSLPVWGVALFGVYPRIFALIFALSFLAPSFSPQSLIKQLETTEVGQQGVRNYYLERQDGETIADPNQGRNLTWYRSTQKLGVHHWGACVLAFSLIIFGTYSRRMNRLAASMFSIGLLMMAFSNLTSFLFALSNRSALIADIFLIAGLLLVWLQWDGKLPDVRFKQVQKYCLIGAFLLMVPFVVYKIADMINFISLFILATPFVPWIDPDANLSIREGIRVLLEL